MYNLKELRRSLFGYSKTSVSEYINQLSEDYSRKLMEQEKIYNAEIEKLKLVIRQLEEENKELTAREQTVAKAIINAEKYQSYLRETVETEAKNLYFELRRKYRLETERLNQYKQVIDNLKRSVTSAIAVISEEVDKLQDNESLLPNSGIEVPLFDTKELLEHFDIHEGL